MREPGASVALPRRLGGFPFWRGNEPFLDAMEQTYHAAAVTALELLAGREPASRAEQ